MTHPLTDEMIEQIAQFEPDLTDRLRYNRDYDMRAGADWQLEEVKRKVELKLTKWRISGCVDADACEDFFEEIMQELRPQQLEDN